MASEQQKPVPEIIAKLTNYEDSRGRVVIEREVVVGEVPSDYVRFVGRSQLNATIPGRGVIQRVFHFAIAADSVVRAFALFDARAQAAGGEEAERLRRELIEQQNALLVPADRQAAALLDASGNPIRG